MPTPIDPVTAYLRRVRQVRRTGHGTVELSFYPAVHEVLSAVGQFGSVPRAALSHPAGAAGQFPDVAVYETVSNVLALPVEVKPASWEIARILGTEQARNYARTFGGGAVLVTNLREFALARLDPAGHLVEERRVSLVPAEADLDAARLAVAATASRDLAVLLESGCQVRGSETRPTVVAHLLAYHARNMRDAITAAGDPTVLLSTVRDALARGLQIELDAQALVPTVVQTLVYGQFAAWLAVDDPQHFDWMQAAYRLKVPVYAEILHETLRPALIRKCDLTGHLAAIARVLAWTDRVTFEAAFDGDAIQYFYEPFLAEFDATLRDELGVWYTPPAIARYQVARAHHHLQTDLGIPEGLASEEVYLLDPAVGTGTYLIEVCQLLYAHHTGNGEPAAVAAGKVQAALTSRLTGFEILPAAFIICHLHLARYVLHLQAPDEDARPRVYLTNSLTGWGADADPAGSTLFPELEEELRDAAVAKRRDPVLVVLGNPPYQGYSTAETAEEKAMLAPWSQELTSAWGLRKHRLNDLYVRFWRIAIERIVHLTERGIISFISNRKWLGGRSYPSMRHALVANFDSIWVDDLHGDVHDRSHPGDESVFKTNIATGIKVGTAIVTAVRTHTTPGQRAAVAWRRDYRGPAAGKRHRLALRAEHGWFTQVYDPLTPTAASRYRLAPDAAGDYPLLDEYLPFFLSGVQPVRDEAVLDTDPARLEARMRSYFDPKLSTPDLLTRHPAFAVVRARYNPARVRIEVLNAGGYDPKRLVRLLYRPMDTRWMYWETASKLLNESRTELLPYWRNVPDQVCLVAAQTPRRDGAVRRAAGHAVGAFASVDPDARVFPLYEPASKLLGEDAGELALDTSGGSGASAVLRTTVAPDWVAATRATLGLPADATGDLTAGETVFYALLAVMHSPEWIASQPVGQDDFPSVPLPADPTELAAAATTGRELLALLDPDQDVPGVTSGTIRAHLRPLAVEDSTPGTVTLTGRYGFTGGDYQGSDVLWGAGGGWRNVPAAVWEFTIGGFPVLSKWLSYRVTSGLTAADRATFRLLVRRIQAILDLAGDCDSAYTAAAAAPLTLP